jgi:hypothetical protein
MEMDRIHVSSNVVKTSLIQSAKGSGDNRKKEERVMQSVLEFYRYKPHLEQLLPILLKKSKISLRILDYFVTNYAESERVYYTIKLYGRSRRFNVYGSYKAQLDAFHKKLFDPFCRRRRIYFEYAPGCEIETTAGQLNFFRWAIQNNVLQYVEDHLEQIQIHMALKNKEKQANKAEELSNLEISGEISQEKDELVAKLGFQKIASK